MPERDELLLQVAAPIRDETRRERTRLLISTLVLYGVVFGNLVPRKITTFGIELSELNRVAVVTIFEILTGYFWLAFVLYARDDLGRWKDACKSLEQAPDRDTDVAKPSLVYRDGRPEFAEDAIRRKDRAAMRAFKQRAAFDVFLPAVICIITQFATIFVIWRWIE